jgi:hypothetical protein
LGEAEEERAGEAGGKGGAVGLVGEAQRRSVSFKEKGLAVGEIGSVITGEFIAIDLKQTHVPHIHTCILVLQAR